MEDKRGTIASRRIVFLYYATALISYVKKFESFKGLKGLKITYKYTLHLSKERIFIFNLYLLSVVVKFFSSIYLTYKDASECNIWQIFGIRYYQVIFDTK